MNKRFIEWDLPLADISEASAHEKNIHIGLPPQFHVWWARKPLSSSRAICFASLIDLPDNSSERKEITNLIRKITPWSSIKDNDHIQKAKNMIKRQWVQNPPLVLDPFAGGGSIPLEMIRLGCKTYAIDYNPLATFLQKATLEFPQKFGIKIPNPIKAPGIDGKVENVNLLLYLVEKWANILLNKSQREIGQFYKNDSTNSIIVTYIWMRNIQCQNPNCNAVIPLTNNFWLVNRKGKQIALKPIISDKLKQVDFEIVNGNRIDFDPNDGTISKSDAKCLVCKQITNSDIVRKLANNGKISEKIVAVVSYNPNKKGKDYRIANKNDISIFNQAKEYLDNKIKDWDSIENPIPDEFISTPTNDEYIFGNLYYNFTPVVLYGMTKWGDLFNSRQKLALITLSGNIRKSFNDIFKECSLIIKNNNINKFGPDELTKAVIGYLGLLIDRQADFTSTLCLWDNGGEISKHVFGRQALQMNWNYSEINPFSNSTGSVQSQIYYQISSLENFIIDNNNIPSVIQGNACKLNFNDNSIDAIITDPPYYDNVPYANLSDFFYVWLKRSIGDFFPEIFSTSLIPKSNEILAELPLLRGMKKNKAKDLVKGIKTKEIFEENLEKSFNEIYRVLKKDGIATIIYAHKTSSGWETMLNSLIKSGLVVTASWPVHSEMMARLRSKASATLASSIYMVCRKTERQKVGFYNEIQQQIKERIITKLQQFWNEGIAGGDFFISAIGPGMEIFSRYERIEKLSGEKVTTSELLEYIRTVSTDFIVNMLLKDASSVKIDNESEFYLAYRWTYLDNTVEYDDARKLASASGINLEKLWGAGGFIKKSSSKITVLGPKERDKIDKTNSMVDVMHKSVLLWEKGEKEKLTQLLAETGYGKDPAFKQFCQAIAESLLNGNKEKQLLEGFLIGIDSYQKAKVKIGKDQTDLSQYGGN